METRPVRVWASSRSARASVSARLAQLRARDPPLAKSVAESWAERARDAQWVVDGDGTVRERASTDVCSLTPGALWLLDTLNAAFDYDAATGCVRVPSVQRAASVLTTADHRIVSHTTHTRVSERVIAHVALLALAAKPPTQAHLVRALHGTRVWTADRALDSGWRWVRVYAGDRNVEHTSPVHVVLGALPAGTRDGVPCVPPCALLDGAATIVLDGAAASDPATLRAVLVTGDGPAAALWLRATPDMREFADAVTARVQRALRALIRNCPVPRYMLPVCTEPPRCAGTLTVALAACVHPAFDTPAPAPTPAPALLRAVALMGATLPLKKDGRPLPWDVVARHWFADCCVCREALPLLPGAPVFCMCRAGHLTCTACHAGICAVAADATCPLCRGSFIVDAARSRGELAVATDAADTLAACPWLAAAYGVGLALAFGPACAALDGDACPAFAVAARGVDIEALAAVTARDVTAVLFTTSHNSDVDDATPSATLDSNALPPVALYNTFLSVHLRMC